MMIKKVEKNFGGVYKGAKIMDFGVILKFKLLFSQSAPISPTKLPEKVYLGVLHHPIKFQAKIYPGKFYLGIKSKKPLGV